MSSLIWFPWNALGTVQIPTFPEGPAGNIATGETGHLDSPHTGNLANTRGRLGRGRTGHIARPQVGTVNED